MKNIGKECIIASKKNKMKYLSRIGKNILPTWIKNLVLFADLNP